jgi:hypothetical protein
MGSSAGTQTAALAFGGGDPPTYPTFSATELYDGTSLDKQSSWYYLLQEGIGAGTGTQTLRFGYAGGEAPTPYSTSSNRRMDWSRFSINSYNHSFLNLYLSI